VGIPLPPTNVPSAEAADSQNDLVAGPARDRLEKPRFTWVLYVAVAVVAGLLAWILGGR
jgi:hypothetical protein